VDKKWIEQYLAEKPRRLPDFKTMNIYALNDLIKARTGMPFARTKGPPLFNHQFRALAAAIYLERAMLFLGMRLGKTRITLEWAQHLRKTGCWKGQGLIIVPSPVVLDVWRDQAEEYVDLSCHIVRTGNLDSLLQALDERPDLTVIAFSTLQSIFTNKKMVKKRGKDELIPKYVHDVEMLLNMCRCFTLSSIDEIHMCKSISSLTYKMASHITLGHEFKLGLTGTPFGRNPFDVWTQMQLIDQGESLGRNYYFFTKAFGKMIKGYMGDELIFDKKKLPLFTARINQSSISYKLEEVRHMQEKKIKTTVPMLGEQLTQYTDTLDRVRDPDALDFKQRNNVFINLLQISNGIVPFHDEMGQRLTTILPSHAKLKWIRQKIAAGDLDQPTVIFHRFLPTGKALFSELTRQGFKCAALNGLTKDRTLEVAKFQSGEADLILCNYQSGSVAIDLSRADWVIYYECAPSSTLQMQAEKRAAGPARGLRPLLHEHLLASPIDERVLRMNEEGKTTLDAGIHSKAKLFKSLRPV
jgi:superfamily II DNA or RNA helicase